MKYDRFGGFVVEIANEVEDGTLEMNNDVLRVFTSTVKSLGASKLLHRGPSTSKPGDAEAGGADDTDRENENGKAGPSFRSDRRIARLLIARHWADQIISKYRESIKAKADHNSE